MAVKKATVAAKSTKAIKKTPATKITAMAAASKAAKTPAKRVHAVKSPVVATPKIDGEQALEQELEAILGGGGGKDSLLEGADGVGSDEGGPFGDDDFDDEDDEDEILDGEDEDEDDGCDDED